jgi:hypothetical protein
VFSLLSQKKLKNKKIKFGIKINFFYNKKDQSPMNKKEERG